MGHAVDGATTSPVPIVMGQECNTHDIKHDSSPTCAPVGAQRPPTSFSSPDDVPDALPPGKVKLLAFVFVFCVWWGSWGGLDVFLDIVGKDKPLLQLFLCLCILVIGVVGLKVLSRRYRGYALLDEIQDMA